MKGITTGLQEKKAEKALKFIDEALALVPKQKQWTKVKATIEKEGE